MLEHRERVDHVEFAGRFALGCVTDQESARFWSRWRQTVPEKCALERCPLAAVEEYVPHNRLDQPLPAIGAQDLPVFGNASGQQWRLRIDAIDLRAESLHGEQPIWACSEPDLEHPGPREGLPTPAFDYLLPVVESHGRPRRNRRVSCPDTRVRDACLPAAVPESGIPARVDGERRADKRRRG